MCAPDVRRQSNRCSGDCEDTGEREGQESRRRVGLLFEFVGKKVCTARELRTGAFGSKGSLDTCEAVSRVREETAIRRARQRCGREAVDEGASEALRTADLETRGLLLRGRNAL
ncbi:hypothetical protein ERJ75_000647300 [Trypanosoma vivax]|nr:hypothetical protein ERJ75_000647300 [Trypanosoma vivax]